uniref:Putative zyg-1-like serine/threonine protein kinase n=2 Tax=Triatoma infestans TaxID=30076 RepID=A0A023F1W4_TRIIF
MYISPSSLQDVCVNYICDNLFELCESVPRRKKAQQGASSSNANNNESNKIQQDVKCNFKEVKFSFRDSDVYFHSEISEQLLRTLCLKGKLTDQTLTLFDPETTRLRCVSIPNASNLSKEGMKIFKGHKITDLEACGLKFTVNDLINCLGEWTLHNLRTLNVARSTFSEGSRHCVTIALSKLKSLHCLDVSGTEFNRHALDIIVEDLPLLESLDISSTRVDDISPLRKCKHRLKHLGMYNLKFIKVPACEDVILELSELRTLDISEEKDNYTFEMFVPGAAKMVQFLKSPECLPHLTSLDISGKGEIGRKELRAFLQYHKELKYLGLVHSDICSEECFTNPKHADYNPNLQVGGVANEEQILLSLKRYACRTLYVQKCLYNLFRLTQTFTDARVDIIELVLVGMELHPDAFGVQMAATACLYNLTKGELGTRIHPQVLAKVVSLCLVAMNNFPSHYQLQKNTLLTLCSDRILQDVPIDRFLCAKLVLESLCAFEDPSMNRMSVAICSILAAKISTSETSQLGSESKYMHKLLRLVRSKKESGTVDITMKFTLSALWNLTDESPTTCAVFLQEGGLALFLDVLKTFPGEAAVETKVLGLINNIAEVPDLRLFLLQPSFIAILRGLLHSKQIDVSYFAAGIMAHLAAEGNHAWTNCEVPRSIILQELGEVVISWDPPEGEMVAYRSFYPFISLLACNDAPQVQLWAVWAIHHVCTKNPQRYCPMLEVEQGSAMLNSMWADTSVDPRVREICGHIRSLLGTYGGIAVHRKSNHPSAR